MYFTIWINTFWLANCNTRFPHDFHNHQQFFTRLLQAPGWHSFDKGKFLKYSLTFRALWGEENIVDPVLFSIVYNADIVWVNGYLVSQWAATDPALKHSAHAFRQFSCSGRSPQWRGGGGNVRDSDSLFNASCRFQPRSSKLSTFCDTATPQERENCLRFVQFCKVSTIIIVLGNQSWTLLPFEWIRKWNKLCVKIAKQQQHQHISSGQAKAALFIGIKKVIWILSPDDLLSFVTSFISRERGRRHVRHPHLPPSYLYLYLYL